MLVHVWARGIWPFQIRILVASRQTQAHAHFHLRLLDDSARHQVIHHSAAFFALHITSMTTPAVHLTFSINLPTLVLISALWLPTWKEQNLVGATLATIAVSAVEASRDSLRLIVNQATVEYEQTPLPQLHVRRLCQLKFLLMTYVVPVIQLDGMQMKFRLLQSSLSTGVTVWTWFDHSLFLQELVLLLEGRLLVPT